MKKYLPYIIIVLVVGSFIHFGFSKEKKIPPANNQQTEQSTDSARETKKDDQANVTVSITPVEISSQSQEWKFDVVMDTHSVELNQDLAAISVLTDDRGNEYRPIRWDGPVGGHHREGFLIFSPISPLPQSFELKITGIGNAVRNFTWQIK